MSKTYRRRGNKNANSKTRFYRANSANSIAQTLANYAEAAERVAQSLANPVKEESKATKSFRYPNNITTNKDRNGNERYVSIPIGKNDKFEYWVQYNEDNQPIWYHDSRGYEWKCTYTRKKNIAEFWDNTGYSETYSYYKNDSVKCLNSFGEKISKIIHKSMITRTDFITAN